MLFIQPWAFPLQFFAIILAGCAKNYFLFVLGKTRRGELGAENLFERGGRAYGVVSEFVKSAFEHVVQDQLHVLALSCVGVAEMEARRHLKLGTFLNNGDCAVAAKLVGCRFKAFGRLPIVLFRRQ